jgi:hypothetical protein
VRFRCGLLAANKFNPLAHSLSAGARRLLIPIRRSEICEACLIRAGRRNALTSVKILLSTRISLALLGMVSAVRYLVFYIL